MAKRWSPRLMALPNGQNIKIGANGHVSPQVPCGVCGRPIRYYKGDMTKWPWYCSKECAAGEPVHKRCECCYGAMRQPTRLSKDHYICKSCSLRMAYLFRRMGSMDARFLNYFVNRFIGDVINGVLEVSYVRVTNGLWEYVPKPSVIKKAEEAKAQPKVKKPLVDEEVIAAIEGGRLHPNGTFMEGHPSHPGRHYRELFRNPNFPPPA